MKGRNGRAGVAAVGAALVIVGLAGCNPQGESAAGSDTADGKGAVSIRGSSPTLTTAVPLTMVAENVDGAHGLEVDLTAAGTSSTIVVDAVLAGQAEYGSAGTATALQAIREGADLKVVAAIADNLQVMVISKEAMQATGVSPTAPIAERVRALKGLTIATGALGSTHPQILRSYLQQYGVDPDEDVSLAYITDASAMISGFEQGRFDAIAYSSGAVEQAIATSGAEVWISGPRGDIPGSGDITTGVIVARSDTVEENPARVDALRAALADALEAVHSETTATGQTLREEYFAELDPAVWDLAWKGARGAYPSDLKFTRGAFEYWIHNDPDGVDSYSEVEYEQTTYGPAQGS
jgi:NitT/TauT family transport system substrate-binding protein